jgi:Protein of unknown function (DUF3575)
MNKKTYLGITFFIVIVAAHIDNIALAQKIFSLGSQTNQGEKPIYQWNVADLYDTAVSYSVRRGVDTTITKETDSISKKYLRNNFKMSLSALTLNNYSFFYERSLSPRISFQAGYRYMPETQMSKTMMAKQFFKYLETDSDTDVEEELENLYMSGNAITGEFRFYFGRKKKGARGFYTSLYGRYTTYNFEYAYDYSNNSGVYNLDLKGDANVLGGGLGTGFQFLIAKRVILDFYIVGVHFGNIKGKASALTDLSDMTAAEQEDLKNELEDFQPLGKQIIFAEVNDNGVNLTIKSPFLGIRAIGLSIGIAF